MPQPSDATDFRRADDDALLRALGEGQPLALAEAYHRSVPAAHAIARRLLGGAGDVESLLLTVFSQLWESPPTHGPLEGWIRRTTWARGTERLRATQTAPASPSSAGLLPDLPAPDVRFLDASERAIAELPDDARRALLLAHDKGVATETQDAGAGEALTAALMALAGPETSATDRGAMDEDGCEDVLRMGDWCLGLLASAGESDVTTAITQRSGCAATSRAVRRGRRRIEGLPATPDMGQRILVSVLTGGSRPPVMAAAAAMAPPDPSDLGPDGDDVLAPISAADLAADDPFAAPVSDDSSPGQPGPADMSDPAADTPAASPVVDTADLPEAGVADTSPSGSWMPGPGDNTAELRLSDILADGEDDDDPFADLADLDPVAADAGPSEAGRPSPRDPYSALRGLGEDEPLAPQGPVSPAFANPGAASPVVHLPEDEALVGDYVEGQEEEHLDDRKSRRLAGVLAWVLPILGGGALGIVVAIQIFGLPN